MIWVHCGDAECVTSTQSLVARLAKEAHEVSVLVSAEQDVLDMFSPFPSGVEVDRIPVDSYKTGNHRIWFGTAVHCVLPSFATYNVRAFVEL